jgi:hypothetical protein
LLYELEEEFGRIESRNILKWSVISGWDFNEELSYVKREM